MRDDRYAVPDHDEAPAHRAWRAFAGGVAGPSKPLPRGAKALVAGAAALAVAAWYVSARVRRADRRQPPQGRFVDIDGTRLHYAIRGEGPAVVLVHGNGSMIDELDSSGLVDLLAQHYRVVVFDRPGFGYSERRRDRRWTPQAQAALLSFALERIGIGRATIVGHSWGALVALALALDHPDRARGLVLVSGYYYPTFRPDAIALSAPAWPVVGRLLRHTTSPLFARLAWPGLLRLLFGPPETPGRFRALSPWRFLKPSRLLAAGEEAAMLTGEARKLSGRYGTIRVPTVILAGEDDRLIGASRHAKRLHRAIATSTLHAIPRVGHMLHHTAPRRVLRAIDDVALRDARGVGPADGHDPGPPLRELLREVPFADADRASG